MPAHRFALFNAVGAAAWSVLYGLLAYELGAQLFERVARSIGVGALVVVVVAGAAILILRRRGFHMVRVISRDPE
jgi:membrane protein DedA with SNARE-associated domain